MTSIPRPKGAPIGPLPPMGNLLAFESVARHQSLARAASELGVTRSALTHSIALLEHRLRLRLVVRYSPLVELTSVGRAYFAASQAFARRLRDDHYRQSPTAGTQIRVSTSRALGRLWLGPRLGDFHARYPRIELIVNTADQLESVLGDGVDVGLRYGGPALPRMVSVPMWEDRLVAVGHPRLARQARLMAPAEALSTLPLVEQHRMAWSPWAEGLVPGGLRVRPRIRTADLQFGVACALQGLGLLIVPRRLVQPQLRAGRLETISAHSTPAKPYHAVVSLEQRQREPMRQFLDWIGEQVAADTAALGA